MGRYDDTSMGGSHNGFQATHWPDILAARTFTDQRRRELVGAIIGRYWKPVYCYLRRKGYANAKAKDLTQGFFQEVVLGRELIQQADRQKGRFRTFLLTALGRYVASIHRAEGARKRRPEAGHIYLEGIDWSGTPLPTDRATPDQAFTYVWASALLDEVIAAVEAGCSKDKQETHWAVFRARVIRPIREDAEPPSLEKVCADFGIPNEKAASNMITTVKRRFQRTLRVRVRQFVATDDEVDVEILDLMRILSGGGAAS